jgi:rhomboid protease GluP
MSLQNENETQQPIETQASVRRATPVFPVYSFVMVACLVIVSICQFKADGGSTILYGGDTSILLAGFAKPAFINGEYWRILTGMQLHIGLIHLLFNCYALYVLGKLIEILSNRAHLVIIFLLAGIGGNILSLIFMPEVNSAGASGGILGFLGYLAVYGYKRRKILPPEFLKNMLFNIGFIALYGIMLYRVIDNFGHLGGVLTGALYGFIQISGDVYKDPRQIGSKMEILGLIALGIFISVTVFSCLVLLRIV